MREHIEHLLAATGALAFALFISYFNTGAIVHVAPVQVPQQGTLKPIATDQAPFPLPSTVTFSTTTLTTLLSGGSVTHAPTATATTTPKTPVVTPKVTTPKKSAPTPTVVVAATTTPLEASSTPTTSESTELAKLKGSIVNILCISHISALRSTSGSGVIVDSRGIVLTVAHVAQMMLLEGYLGRDKVSCTIRTGSPARNAYLARPIYISEAWIKQNSTTLISSSPTGTGEHDYALLAITDTATKASLPTSFPSITLSGVAAHIGDAVSIGTYGSQELSITQVQNALYPTLVTSTVADRYTFDTNTVDVLAIAGSDASQEGSSGGAVVNDAGNLIGIVTTSEVTGAVSSRTMRVITPDYIRRSYMTDTGRDFIDYFADTSMTSLVNSYAPTVQNLGQFLAQAVGISN